MLGSPILYLKGMRRMMFQLSGFYYIRNLRPGRGKRAHLKTYVNPIKLESGLRPNSAELPHTLLLRIEAMGFPTFGLLL